MNRLRHNGRVDEGDNQLQTDDINSSNPPMRMNFNSNVTNLK